MTGRPNLLGRIGRLTWLVVLPALAAWWISSLLFYRVHPETVKHPPPRADFGPFRMTIRLPGTCAGIPEPLLTCGEPGKAVFIYIRIVGKTRALIGVDLWGQPPVEGPEFSVPSPQAELKLVCRLPVFFPDEMDSSWGKEDNAMRHRLRSSFQVVVDGVERASGPLNYPMAQRPPVYVGANPIGGSVVSDFFTGTVTGSSQSL
jgi:hypothetical protein